MKGQGLDVRVQNDRKNADLAVSIQPSLLDAGKDCIANPPLYFPF